MEEGGGAAASWAGHSLLAPSLQAVLFLGALHGHLGPIRESSSDQGRTARGGPASSQLAPEATHRLCEEGGREGVNLGGK